MTATTERRPLSGADLDRFLADLTLQSGAHDPDGVMCVMEASAYIAGEPWSDHPRCVSPVIAAFLRRWNDGMNDTDRQMLKPYVVKVLNTRADDVVERRRAYLAADWAVHTSAATWLRVAGLEDVAKSLDELAPITDEASARAARPVMAAARQKAYAAAASDAAAYAYASAAAASDAAAAAYAYASSDAAAYAYASAAAAAYAAAAYAYAYADADAKLRPTVERLQRSALELVDGMIACGETA